MFGVSKSEETNTALDKAAAVVDSPLSLQEQNWFCKAVVVSLSATEPQSYCYSLPPSFNLNFGTYSLPLTIIISTVFKRLGLQIHWYSNNELRH